MEKFVLMKCNMKQQGFTLIEVIIALVIISIGLIALTSAKTAQISQIAHTQNKIVALWVANNVVGQANIELIDLPTTQTTRHGEIELMDKTWYWKLSSALLNTASTQKQLTVEVGLAPDHSLVELVSYVD